MTRNWDAARRKVEAEGRCRRCRRTENLQAAHVIPRSLGGGMNADSVIVLCLDCHQAQHLGKFELLPLLTRDEQAEAVRVVGIARAFRYLAPSAYDGGPAPKAPSRSERLSEAQGAW